MGVTERAAYCCAHVFSRTHPILLVVHEDGDLMFLCNAMHEGGELPHVVGLNHLLARDPTLPSLLDLPDGWEAERASASSQWLRTPTAAKD